MLHPPNWLPAPPPRRPALGSRARGWALRRVSAEGRGVRSLWARRGTPVGYGGGSGHRGEGWAGQVTGFVSVELIKLIQKGAAAQFKDLQVPPRACAAGWDAPGLAPSTCVHTAVFPPHQFLMVFAAMIFVVICSSLFICRSACVRCRRIWRCRC